MTSRLRHFIIAFCATSLLAFTQQGCAERELGTDSHHHTELEMSYGQLAKARIPALFTEVVQGLGQLHDASLPHEAKAIRKAVGKLRLYVDVFVYAYPKTHGDDLWEVIRDDLDDGYEALGHFKDLFDAQGVPVEEVEYEPEKLEERRAEALAWIDHFLAPETVDSYRAYLSQPDLEDLHDRKKKHLSPFFWGGIGKEPKKSRTGVQNIARLGDELLKVAEDEFEDIEDVDDLTDVDEHEVFHDFRKRVRTVVKLETYFPLMRKPGTNPDELTLAIELVDRYGNLNDRLLAYEELVEDGDEDTDEGEDLADEIEEAWEALEDWQKEADIDDLFDDWRDEFDEK